eukprot:Gregarina_sp_Pseudo_9__5442@NODE_681_length_2382_cov_9_919761_g644_i0_p2_GENE_NODE_681_length_2382_cov_9_919761_g644_i0NODE_681_length_2382_cov_9_919761_g644_i0_p2_ORF_typecomplete_len338_score51_43LPMO_10/PF03067_15/2_2e07_NODE_681_length_2382_cov_9_919761_g644_i013372350
MRNLCWMIVRLSLAWGMGYMVFPPTRNLRSGCPHCATGKGVCGNGDKSVWNESLEPSNLLSSTMYGKTVLYSEGIIEIAFYIKATTGGVFVAELCPNPGEVIEDSCFRRLKQHAQSVSPILPEVPTHVWLTTTAECMDSHKEELENPVTVTFEVPPGMETEHGILRFWWQLPILCSPHEYLNKDTFDSTLMRFTYQDVTAEGGPLTCDILPLENLALCGTDCPSVDPGCNQDHTHIKNCADVVVRPHTECLATDNCPAVTLVNGVVEYPGDCRAILGDISLCNTLQADSDYDKDLCTQLCREIYGNPTGSASFWCRLRGLCALQQCAVAYSDGKCRI